jgi:hypothetical protein
MESYLMRLPLTSRESTIRKLGAYWRGAASEGSEDFLLPPSSIQDCLLG